MCSITAKTLAFEARARQAIHNLALAIENAERIGNGPDDLRKRHAMLSESLREAFRWSSRIIEGENSATLQAFSENFRFAQDELDDIESQLKSRAIEAAALTVAQSSAQQNPATL